MTRPENQPKSQEPENIGDLPKLRAAEENRYKHDNGEINQINKPPQLTRLHT